LFRRFRWNNILIRGTERLLYSNSVSSVDTYITMRRRRGGNGQRLMRLHKTCTERVFTLLTGTIRAAFEQVRILRTGM